MLFRSRSVLLTPSDAARATAFRGTVYATHDAFPICMNLPTGFLCAHTFDSDTTHSPFPTMAAVHVTDSAGAARSELARETAYIRESDRRTTILAAGPTSLVTVTRGLTAGGLAQTPVLEADVLRIVGSSLVSGTCAQAKSVAAQSDRKSTRLNSSH